MKESVRKLLALILTVLLLGANAVQVFAEETAPAEQEPAAETASEQAAAEKPGIIDTEELDRWAEDFFSERGIDSRYQDLSIGFCYTGTGDSWYYNADVWMYSASMYKVPVAMLLAEKVASGELTQQSVVNGTTVEYVESTALVYSNNDSGHSIVSYLGGTYAGKCSDMTEKYTDLPADYFSSDFIDLSYYTARYMTQVMKTLYDGGDEQFPHIIEYLLQAQPGAYYKCSPVLSPTYEIAQKFGAYEEPNGNNNNHCAAIIYTPTPIVVTVMTRNIMDYQRLIAQVGEHLAEYSLELDQKAEEQRQAEAERAAAAAAAPEAVAPAQGTDTESVQPDSTSPAFSAAPSSDSTAPSGSVQEEKTNLGMPKGIIVAACVVAAMIVVASVIYFIRRWRDGDEPDDDEIYGWGHNNSLIDEEPDEEEPKDQVVRRESREKTAPKEEKTQMTASSDGKYRPRH